MSTHPLSVRLRFRAVRENVSWMREVVESLLLAESNGAFSRDDVQEILLALQEVLTNVMRHAYDQSPDAIVDLRVVIRAGRFVARVRDRGRPFVPEAVPVPDLERPREHGNGLFLVRSVMDVVRHGRRGRTNFVHLERAGHRERARQGA